jgi:hypothetical protein
MNAYLLEFDVYCKWNHQLQSVYVFAVLSDNNIFKNPKILTFNIKQDNVPFSVRYLCLKGRTVSCSEYVD